MQSERSKMLQGALYDPFDAELVAARLRARTLCARYNASDPAAGDTRRAILAELLDASGDATIEPPFHCDYGVNITLGTGVFFNFNCVVLDVARVVIGDRVLIGPAVQIYTARHPLAADARRRGLESGHAITIDADAWIGGGAILCPGVHVGARAVVGAGSVVTRDVPPDVVVAGNPARVIRALA